MDRYAHRQTDEPADIRTRFRVADARALHIYIYTYLPISHVGVHHYGANATQRSNQRYRQVVAGQNLDNHTRPVMGSPPSDSIPMPQLSVHFAFHTTFIAAQGDNLSTYLPQYLLRCGHRSSDASP